MQKLKHMGIVACGFAIMVALAIAIPTARHLARTQAESEAAWRDVAQLQAARIDGANAALNAIAAQPGGATANAMLSARARVALARAQKASGDDVLHDPAAINAWKQAQGELTGALFMLVTGEDTGAPAAIEQLRRQLEDEEEALAVARMRYSQASAEYAAVTHTVAGASVATLLRYPELPATL